MKPDIQKQAALDRAAIITAAQTLTEQIRKQGYLLDARHGGAIHYYTTSDGAIEYARLRLKHPGTGEKWIRPLRRNVGLWNELKAPEFEGGAPIYNLNQLCDPARQSERVILTEGEYKVDMLALRGILATTSGGAQSVQAADWQPLSGRNVLVWPDNDKAGFEYAQHVAAKLTALGCEVVFVDVAALNLPVKGDCVDWLKAFHQQHGHKATAADVWALPVIERAPENVEAEYGDSSHPNVSGEAIPLLGSTAQADTRPALSDVEIIRYLASLPKLEYERARKEQAKALNCRPAVLDDLVKAERNDESEADRLPFAEVEPHPDPIDPAQLLDEVADTIRKIIVLDAEQAHAATLWVALTWFIDVVEYAPLAIINAPEKSCGKSHLLFLFGRMVCRPLMASNMRGATLFRIAEKWHPAILIDEADTFIKTDDDIAGLINAGHTRDGAFAWRLVGDNFEPKAFDIWGAKALTGIALGKHLPDATMSRGIIFEMRRKLPSETVMRLRDAKPGLFETLSSKLARFAADYSQQVKLARPVLPDVLSDRDQNNWEPLLAIASCAGDEWLAKATAAALKLSGAAEKTQSTGNELLADIRHIFERKKLDKISTVGLIAALCDDPEGAWATFNRGGKEITPRQVARLLKAYGIASKTIRLGAYETPKGFELSQFSDAFVRYLATP